jgi:hypothetical protein
MIGLSLTRLTVQIMRPDGGWKPQPGLAGFWHTRNLQVLAGADGRGQRNMATLPQRFYSL